MPSIAPPAHTRSSATTDSWITPKPLIDALGPFDLDPCVATPMPWPTATRMIDEAEDGLLTIWDPKAFVFLNPPYGSALGTWLSRLAVHNHGIALTFARTDTKAFTANVWPHATSLLFIRGRLTFCDTAGQPSNIGNSGGPSVLIAYGPHAHHRLVQNLKLGQLVIPYR